MRILTMNFFMGDSPATRRLCNAIEKNKPPKLAKYLLMNTFGVQNPDLVGKRIWIERRLLTLLRSDMRLLSIAIMVFIGFMGCNRMPQPYQANGVKIGEVTQTSAIIWTRLTQAPERKTDGIPFNDISWKRSADDKSVFLFTGVQIPEGASLDQMIDAIPGVPGQIRIVYWEKENEQSTRISTPWAAVDERRDYTHQFQLTNLKPGVRYAFKTEPRNSGIGFGSSSREVSGSFRTAPTAQQPGKVVFTVVTGQGYHRRDNEQNGHKIYPLMQKLKPDFFVHTGDIVYYDKRRPLVHSTNLARFKWNRTYALPFQREFHNEIPSYFIKDDHDTHQDDCWPDMENNKMGEFTFEQGQAIFLEQVPMGKKTYRTVRWGTDLQIWLVEGRDFRSPNTMVDGPEKTIWGPEQKDWFKRTVQASDATFRVLISPMPIVGPDRVTKNDNHANAGFKHEGDELRQFIGRQENMVVVCGDRHWQYISRDPETGVREYSCGPTSDKHAGGFQQELRQPMHRYLNIVGGFLSGTVERLDGKPTLIFRFHGTNGDILREDRLVADQQM
jgi:alkaline phosphatase D